MKSIKAAFLYEPTPDESVPWYLFFKHRHFRAFAFLMMCLCNTNVFYGWQPFSPMLYRSGAYQWRCTPAEINSFVDEYDYCRSQSHGVKALFNIALGSEFVCSIVAGFLLDRCGPLITGSIGAVGIFAGWLMLSFSSASFQAHIPAMILAAGSINLVSFPCLALADFYPSRAGLALSLVVGAQMSASGVAPVMKAIWDSNPSWSFSHLIQGYIYASFIPIVIFYILCLPVKRPALVVEEILPPTRSVESPLEIRRVQSTKSDFHRQSTSPVSFARAHSVRAPIKRLESHLRELRTSPTIAQLKIPSKAFFEPTLWKQVGSVEFLSFTAFYVLQVIAFGYYPNTVLDEFGRDVANVQGYILPSQGVFCTLFGLVVDRTGTLPLCIVVTLMMAVAYVLALIRVVGLQYLTTMLFVISNSYIYTTKYTYVDEIFPPTHFGLMVGWLGFLAGVLGLINIPIQDADAYTATCIAYIVVGGLSILIILYLWYRQRQGVNFLVRSVLT